MFGLHQRVSVDLWWWQSPTNNYLKTGEFAITFGPNSTIDAYLGSYFGVEDTGHVYQDFRDLKSVLEVKHTTPQEDMKTRDDFDKLLENGGKKDQYSIFTNSCRTFSQNTFNSN